VTLCLIREELARTCPPAEELFAIQGLGSYPILLAGTESQKCRWLPALARGESVPAFALTEPGAGSDAGALSTRAESDGDHWVLTGTKRFISNAPAAHLYVVFARTGSQAGTRGLSAFVVPRDVPGLTGVAMHTLAPHVIGELRFDRCRVPADHQLGDEGEGWRVAMGTLDVFRASVGARLLVYSAARLKDAGAASVTLESAMAKLFATEVAGRVVDQAVQIHGGDGVLRGSPIERLYREVRAPRIYEGTSEIQRLIIARQLLRDAGDAG
jgi:alkylation response protein AidB-like acyl-CoA dehydrogenase